jgi:hypothetical protein
MSSTVTRLNNHTYTFTRLMPIGVLEEHLYMHRKFKNSSGTFCGRPVTKLESARLGATLPENWPLDYKVAFCCDEPDYVVWSGEFPILWHATSRPDSVAWVCAGGWGSEDHDGFVARVYSGLVRRESMDSDSG